LINFLKEILEYLQNFRSVELVQDSLTYFLRNSIPISIIIIPFALPSIFFSVYSFYIFDLSGNAFLAKYFHRILEHILSPISTGALIVLFSKTINSEKWSYSRCILSGISFWPKLFIATIIAEILIVIGFFLLIIPGIILTALLGFYDFFIVLEKNRVVLSLKNSAAFAKNYIMEIIGSFLLILAPILWINYILHGPLSAIFYGSEITSIFSDLFLSVLEILILVLFFRFYCFIKLEKHNNSVEKTALTPRCP
jgi:hypothetical protein